MNLTDSISSYSFIEILDNAVLAWSLLACGIAQVSKLLFELILHRKWRPSVLIETGGMPSSHSALVTGAASGIGLQMGFDHPSFALAATMAFVVMYDASGVRNAAGQIASQVNLLPRSIWAEAPKDLLKESLGHTRLEVLIGSLLGPFIAIPGIVLFGSPLHLMQMLGVMTG